MLIIVTEEGHKPRLVDAPSVKAAVKFVMPTVSAKKASAADVASLMANGTKVEVAGD